MSTVLSPIIGENRLNEMLSPSVSVETKGWAARWYAEMIVELFLSDDAKQSINCFSKLSLGEKIKAISEFYSKDIIDCLYTIESIGNMAAHFNLDQKLNDKNVKLAVDKAISLFDLILIDILKKIGLACTPNTTTILSTMLPSIRVNVLQKFVSLNEINSEYDVAVFDKYLLALVKNNQREKARRLTRNLLKKGIIEEHQYKFWEDKINIINRNLPNLPVAINKEDCKRNFEDVLSKMSDEDKQKNKPFINILKIMYENVQPSEFGELTGNKIYLQ